MVFASIIFCLAYIFSVLTFQTYTITRYGLPVIPFMLMAVAFSMGVIKYLSKSKIVLTYTFLTAVVFVSAFFSTDPISLKIWGKEEVLGENLYALNRHLAGNDGLTYNIQYLQAVKKRSSILTNPEAFDQNQNYCHWVFADPANDLKVAKILRLNDQFFHKCKII